MDRVTCLVVEDDESNRLLMKNILSKMDINCIFAYDGIEAVDKFLKNRDEFNFIIMDIIMPGIDGIQASNLIKESSNIPIIICTADITDNTKNRLSEIAIEDFLLKPISVKDMINSINIVLEKYNIKKVHQTKSKIKLYCENKLNDINRSLLNSNFEKANKNTILLKYILSNNGFDVDLLDKFQDSLQCEDIQNGVLLLELITEKFEKIDI